MTSKVDTLAALGGEPVCQGNWPKWPIWGKTEAEAVQAAVNSGGWGICPEPNFISRFSERFAKAHQVEHALCCSNGTVAIMIALRAAGVLPGDEVILPSYTFMATATAAIGIGATPVIVDVDPATLNLDPSRIEAAITERTKAILPVHIAGMPAAMDEINALAKKHDLKVVEDAAQAHLAEYDGKFAGGLGDLGTFSFQSSKNLCSGEGGLVTTNNTEYFRVAHAFHHCGRDPLGGSWYDHPYMGQNLRLSQVQAALLNSQMDRLAEQHACRVENGRFLAEKISALDGVRVIGWPWPDKVTRPSYHIFLFSMDPDHFGGTTSQAFCEAMRAEGVPCHGGYDRSLQDYDFFEDPFVERMLGESRPNYKEVDTPASRHAVKHSIWLKQFQLLADRHTMEGIVAAVEKICRHGPELPAVAEKK